MHIHYIPENGHLQTGLQIKSEQKNMQDFTVHFLEGCQCNPRIEQICEINFFRFIFSPRIQKHCRTSVFCHIIDALDQNSVTVFIWITRKVVSCKTFAWITQRHYFMHLNIIGIFRPDQKAKNTEIFMLISKMLLS